MLPSPMQGWAAAQKSLSKAGEIMGCWGEDGECWGGPGTEGAEGWEGAGWPSG